MADIKTAYASSANYTITLASLGSSATLVAGRESTAVSNTSNLYLDYLVGGLITVGTTPTADTTIEVWAYGARNDTPDYPDVFDGTDSAETVTTRNHAIDTLAWIATMQVDSATSDRGYYFGPVSLAAAFGRKHGGALWVPTHHGIFLVHNTGVALNSTAGNHEISYTGVYMTSA
jgi:hypothetical protein